MARRKELTYEERLTQSLAHMARTIEGKLVLRHILRQSDYHGEIIHLDADGKVDEQGTQYHLGMRVVYQNLRKRMDFETIALIEKADPPPPSKAKKEKPENDQEESNV